MWKEGTIGIPKKNGGYKSVKYWVKYFDEPSEDYGTNDIQQTECSSILSLSSGKSSKIPLYFAFCSNRQKSWIFFGTKFCTESLDRATCFPAGNISRRLYPVGICSAYIM